MKILVGRNFVRLLKAGVLKDAGLCDLSGAHLHYAHLEGAHPEKAEFGKNSRIGD